MRIDCGSRAVLVSPRIPCDPTLEIVCHFMNFVVKFTAPTAIYDLIQKPWVLPLAQ